MPEHARDVTGGECLRREREAEMLRILHNALFPDVA